MCARHSKRIVQWVGMILALVTPLAEMDAIVAMNDAMASVALPTARAQDAR